jgi:hypothetical protein
MRGPFTLTNFFSKRLLTCGNNLEQLPEGRADEHQGNQRIGRLRKKLY